MRLTDLMSALPIFTLAKITSLKEVNSCEKLHLCHRNHLIFDGLQSMASENSVGDLLRRHDRWEVGVGARHDRED